MDIRRRCEDCNERLVLAHEEGDKRICCFCPKCGKTVFFRKT